MQSVPSRFTGYSSLIAFLSIIVAEKLLLLHLPPDWMLGVVKNLGGAPAAFGLALLFFGARRIRGIQKDVRWSLPASLAHIGLLLAVVALQVWYQRLARQHLPTDGLLPWIAGLWTALLPLTAASLVLAFVPFRSALRLCLSLGPAWIYALIVSLIIVWLRRLGASAWTTSSSGIVALVQQTCFRQTRALLGWFYPKVVSDPATHILGTPRFRIEVSWLCSGVEGLLLVALLTGLWIFFLRKEIIVKRALLLIPVALLLAWCANIVRLAVLIAIGDHGYRHMASVGFHAQAGWVTLNLITLGCLVFAQRSPWFRKDGQRARVQERSSEINYAVVYLLPFTAILCASFLTQTLTEGLETFYFLRPLAALTVLWVLRKHYRRINWRFGVAAILVGAAISAAWLFIALRMRVVSLDALIAAKVLGHMSRLHRWSWIATRVFAASVTVPIAEELAFRGFVARRVMRSEFQDVAYRDMNWVSLVVSSLAFGAMHGRMWIAGTVAGALFWALAKYRNRLGDAVAAHAVANAVIAVVAVRLHDYTLW